MPSLERCLILLLLLAAACPTMSQQSRTDTLLVHFAFDRSTIRPADSAILAAARPGADSIILLGYTDTLGSDGFNLRLSNRRAEATRAAILQMLKAAPAAARTTPAQPLPAAAPPQPPPIRIDPRGETNPLPGDDSLSRRVEVILFYQVKDTPRVNIVVDIPRGKPDDEPDTTFGLDNINFVANTPILTDDARDALPHSIDYLRNFKDRYLEIDGFCNQPGPPLTAKDPLFILSVKRAKFIYDYLIQQGFDSTHLRYKGMGNTNPVNAHPTTAHEMDQNMRVEIRVFRKPPPQQQP